MNTRLLRIIRQIFLNSQYQFYLFQNVFTYSIFYLFLGFITGNAFCTLFSFLQNVIIWDGLIVMILIFFFEKLGKKVYKSGGLEKTQTFLKCLNCWKTGILLGFFLDAFKVGS